MKPGDTVVLKSGSPRMTVTNVTERDSGNQVNCQWFVDGKLESGRFLEVTLKVDAVKVYGSPKRAVG